MYCEGENSATVRGQSGKWVIEAEFDGWISGTSGAFFVMWDGFKFQGEHFVDSSVPWTMVNDDFSLEDNQ